MNQQRIPRERTVTVQHQPRYGRSLVEIHVRKSRKLNRYSVRFNLGNLWSRFGCVSLMYEVGPDRQTVAGSGDQYD